MVKKNKELKKKLIEETYDKIVSEGGSPGQTTWDKQAKETIRRVKKLLAKKGGGRAFYKGGKV